MRYLPEVHQLYQRISALVQKGNCCCNVSLVIFIVEGHMNVYLHNAW